MTERRKLAMKTKFCVYCLNPEVVFDMEHMQTCRESKHKSKSSYTCVSPNCSAHYWICTNHSEDNKSKLQNAAKNVSKHGLELALLGTVTMTSDVSPSVVTAAQSLEQQVTKELLPVPEGQPMFLFFGAKGKTRSLMTFFDSGCSRFLMRECIPGKELPASLVSKGPIPIGGVGGISVYATGEYLVAMDTSDGRAQQRHGVTVPVITGDFPQLDVTAAVAAVKAGDKRNTKLKNCRFPPQVGGSVDCLIGIQYNQLQPKLIHMLPSGLAIYETKLAPHSKDMNFVLGGSHTSFDQMLARSGNATFLLNEFIAGLTTWRSLGPPSLTQLAMTEHEIHFATQKNLDDDEFHDYKKLLDVEREEFSAYQVPHAAIQEHPEPSDAVTCIDCGVAMMNFSDVFFYEDEKLSRLKQ